MAQRLVERRLAGAERLRGNRDAAAVERPQHDAEALARRAEQRVGIDPDVVKLEVHAAETADAERVGRGDALDAGRVHRHEERADAAAAHAGLRRGEHDHEVGRLGVGDPDLAPVERRSRARRGAPRSAGWRRRTRRAPRTARTRRCDCRRSPAGGSQSCFCASLPNRASARRPASC